jgi:diguanylate cyclase (GGDEF)-like protein/hemerythrin-like metal-binding protein
VHRRLDGSDFFVEVSIASMALDGKPALFTTWRDITKRKKAEEELEESKRKLEVLSLTDGLTGIANRRHFDRKLEEEYARHARSGEELSLILLDIDLFKAFNDCYGHLKGDDCLRRIARVMEECAARPGDLAARYGGEEFACILPETDRRGAFVVAEKIRRGIPALAIPHEESTVARFVTASLGVVTVKCGVGGAAAGILALADELLYKAKALGRNRLECNQGEPGLEIGHTNPVQLIWKDSFRSGNQSIDARHQSLFHIGNELLEAILAPGSKEKIRTVVCRLLDEAAEHFRDEERILESAGFPDLKEHARAHEKLLEDGLGLLEGFTSDILGVGDIFQFLVYELVQRHMLASDTEYWEHLSDG